MTFFLILSDINYYYYYYRFVSNRIVGRHIRAAHEKMKLEAGQDKRELSLLERFIQQESGEKIAFAMTLELITAGIDTVCRWPADALLVWSAYTKGN